MNRLRRYFVLLSFIFCLFIQINNLFALDENGDPTIDAGQEQGGGFYATSPECSSGLSEVIVGSITLIIAGKDFIIPGIIDLVSGTPIQKVIGTVRLGIGMTMITAVIVSMSTSFQCFFSFVRDPVVYQDDDVGKPMLNDEGKPVTKRWEASNAFYSQNINVCARPIMPFLTMVVKWPALWGPIGVATAMFPQTLILSAPLAAVVAGARSDDMSCYGTNSDYGSSNKIYDGEKAFLCPEEWRFHGYKSEIKPDPDNKNKKTKFAIVGNGVTDESQIDQTEVSKAYENFLYMRQHDGPLVCKNGKVGDDLNIFGYKYEIVKMGAKICAVLKGLGNSRFMIPSITGSFVIGCHYTKPDDPAPLCDKSTPIYAQDSSGNFVLDPATKEKIILDYDNSGCFSCFIDSSCHGTSAGHSKAVMPLTSYVMECLNQTMKNVVMGCIDKTTGKRGLGMLTRANEKLKDLTYILITLAVILFAFKILFTNNLPKLNEIMFLVIKIGVIFYCIEGNQERNGIQWLYKQITNLSGGISSVVLRASSYQTEMCKFTDDMYLTHSADLSFIKPYDMLDCRLFFYLGGALYGYNYSQSVGVASWDKIIGNAALKIINIIFPLFGLLDPIAFICGVFLLVFAIVTLGFAVWMLSLLVLSMIMLFFLILIAPIVLPMMLFNYTKGFFENWTKELIAYTLFPSLLFLFFGLVMAIFDTRMFGDTRFIPIEIKVNKRPALHFVFQDINCLNNTTLAVCKKCREFFVDEKNCDGCDPTSLACKIRTTELNKNTTLWGQSNLKIDKQPKFFVDLLESIGFILLMAVIFYTLVTAVAFLLAEMLGKVRSLYEIINHGVSPMTAFLKISKYAVRPTIKANKSFFSAFKKKEPESTKTSGGIKT